MTVATSLSETVQPFAARLDASGGRLTERASPHVALALVEELAELAELSSGTADTNVNAALENGDDETFLRAQGELQECRRRLATLMLKVLERYFAHVPADLRRRLSKLALIELAAPLMDRPGLERFRRNVAWIRERRNAGPS